MSAIDRSAVSRALAKAIAYKQAGADRKAEAWAYRLVELLQYADILDGGSDAAIGMGSVPTLEPGVSII